MTKAIFFDIDGTLVPLKTKVYGASVKQALEKLRSRGILLFVATGRSKFEIASEHLLDGLQFDGYLTNNGQDAYDASGNLIYGKPIDPRDAESLLNWAEKKGCTFWMVSAEKTCINHPSEPFLQAMHALHTAPPPAGDLREMLRRPVYKIVLFLSREEMAEPLRLAPHCRSTQWFEQGHDIISLDGGKENAMHDILKRYGIDLQDSMAFGDSENDVSMLKAAGIGVAMGNATAQAKAAADYVTDDAEKDGIYKALRHFELI